MGRAELRLRAHVLGPGAIAITTAVAAITGSRFMHRTVASLAAWDRQMQGRMTCSVFPTLDAILGALSMQNIEYASSRLAVAIVDDVHIAVHGESDPDDTDWEAYLDAATKILKDFKAVRGLVYTYGGNPSGPQRSQINKKLNEGLEVRVAVMVESRMARGAVTALSWFNPSVKAYSLEQFDDAMEHLGLSGEHAARVRHALESLKSALRSADG